MPPKNTRTTTKPISKNTRTTKTLLPPTHDKNGKQLTTIQKMNAIGLRNNGRSNISQQEKMKITSLTYRQYAGTHIQPERFLPSELNEWSHRGFK